MALPSGILARARSGDRAARSALVDEHGALVYGMCRRISDDPDDSYQEVWEKVFGGLHRFDPDGTAPLRGWIATITRRHLIDRHRRQKVRGVVLPLDGLVCTEPSPLDRIDRAGLARRLDAALERLPDDQRQAVVLHYIHDTPLGVLSAETGVPVGTLKSRLHRGRARLAKILRSSS